MKLRFSQRMGKKPIKAEIQIESMDDDLRIGLWNAVQVFFVDPAKHVSFHIFLEVLWTRYFKLPRDNLDGLAAPSAFAQIRIWFFKWEWFEVYDFIEYISHINSPANKSEFKAVCNRVLEEELSGYRFVNDEIAPITDETELGEIGKAIEDSGKTRLSGVHIHLKSALSKLSDRKSPDYRNSIKESISAVEAISQVISGNPKATLTQALKKIESDLGLHPALKEGFIKIYGYTSDADGIRHCMVNESRCDFEDAKYMLVSCSAFINYLIMKATKAGIGF